MTDAPHPAPAQTSLPAAPAPTTTWRRLMPPIAALTAALIFTTVATLRWDRWIGGMAVQMTDDAYVRAQLTQLSARVAAAVKTVEVNDFQRVRAGDLLLQIDPADYLAQVAQAEASEAGARAVLDNLANQVALQNATIAQAEAQQVSAVALALEAQQEQARQQSLMQTQSGTLQKLQQAIAASGKAQADVKASEAAVAAQRQQLAVLAGTRQQRAADLQGAKAALDAARLRLGHTRYRKSDRKAVSAGAPQHDPRQAGRAQV